MSRAKLPAPPRALLAGWMRRFLRVAPGEPWVLRGGMLLESLCPGRRPPKDVDYLVNAPFDQAHFSAIAGRVVAEGDPHTHLDAGSLRTEGIWLETEFPGLRFHVTGNVNGLEPSPFQVDLGVGDPLSTPPILVPIADVGDVLACAPETLFAWKLHGLIEFGRGQWRAKDLADLYFLLDVPMDGAKLRAAIEAAFSSRGAPLALLDDFRARDGWGQSTSGRKRWRVFVREAPSLPPSAEARAKIAERLEKIL